MELTSPAGTSLKINSKKGSVIINPDTTDDAKIVIIDDDAPDISNKFPDTLVIFGPGEFEVGGIMVKGTRQEGNTTYEIDAEEGKVLHVLSNSISKLSTEDEYEAVIVKALTSLEESDVSSLSSKLVVVYGDPQNISDSLKQNKVNKINLRKRDEITTNVVYLEKK